jgi:glycosyltransferase involved in cell wall biosynthesis
LAIVDSFNAGCPIVTTNYPYHSPEIAYLQSGFNGIQTEDNVESFSNAAVTLLNDEAALETLRQGCMVSANQYTLENMVENFATGIERCVRHGHVTSASSQEVINNS